jgi:hypothetical protein
MGKKRKLNPFQNTQTCWLENCGKVYEHICYSKECENIINAHNFLIDGFHNVPICNSCNKSLSKREIKSGICFGKTKSTDPLELPDSSSTSSFSLEDYNPNNKNFFSYLFPRNW